MTYVVALDALSADVHAYSVGRSVAAALGGESATDLPTWDTIRTSFDAYLTALPDDENPDHDTPRAVMLRALGLR